MNISDFSHGVSFHLRCVCMPDTSKLGHDYPESGAASRCTHLETFKPWAVYIIGITGNQHLQRGTDTSKPIHIMYMVDVKLLIMVALLTIFLSLCYHSFIDIGMVFFDWKVMFLGSMACNPTFVELLYMSFSFLTALKRFGMCLHYSP